MKSLASRMFPFCWVLAVLAPLAEAEILYDRDGIQLQGTVRISYVNSATCHVLEEKYDAEEYKRLKDNEGQPLHIWRIDLSVHNNSGKPIEFLRARFNIESPSPPCTNWSGDGPGGGPEGDLVDAEGNPGFLLSSGLPFYTISKPYGMAAGEVDRETVFLLVFHENRPVIKEWDIDYYFPKTRVPNENAPVTSQSGKAAPKPAPRPRIQLPPDILADKYLLQARTRSEEKDYKGALEAMDRIVALQKEHGLTLPEAFPFHYAQTALAAGSPQAAIESVNGYLTATGREGKHYREALELLVKAERGPTEPAVDRAGTAKAEQRLQEPAAARAGSGGTTGSPPGASGIRVGETVVFDGITFVGIPPGEFLMGSTSEYARDDERPLTRVKINKGFYLGKYEVTQVEWQAVMGDNPSMVSRCGRCPVEQVSWEDVQVFIGKLNSKTGEARYRLPTEAEWEYAARAGTDTDTYAGEMTAPKGNDPVVNEIAWYVKNSSGRAHPVGQKTPNGFGLYDMLGNVWEWVGDWYGDYPGGTVPDPAGPGSGSARVDRGGGWIHFARYCRTTHRNRAPPGLRNGSLGFRLLRTE